MGLTVSDEIERLKAELQIHWENHLKSHGVEFPTGCKLAQLICLYANFESPVKKSTLKRWLVDHDFDCNSQARHVADLGWNVASGNPRFKRGVRVDELQRDEYLLLSVSEPNPKWIESKELKALKKKIPSKKKYEKIMLELEEIYEKYLKQHGMKFFTEKSVLAPIALAALYYNLGKPVSQNEISLWYKKFGFEYKHQARGLAQQGWYVATGNPRGKLMDVRDDMTKDQLMLVSAHEPNPIWLRRTRATRSGNFSNLEWTEVLDIFKERGCAVCGEKSKHYDKGHLDSRKPASAGNIVPMCSSCNNWAGGRLIDFKMEEGTLKARPIVDSRVEEE